MKSITIISLMILLITGCTTGPGLDIDSDKYSTITIPTKISNVKDIQSPDTNNPIDMVFFASHLSNSGSHSKSAMLYNEIAKFDSKDNEWKISCLTAAAVEFLKAGELMEFKATVNEIKSTQNKFQRIIPHPLTETVFQISKLMESPEINKNELKQEYWTLIKN